MRVMGIPGAIIPRGVVLGVCFIFMLTAGGCLFFPRSPEPRDQPSLVRLSETASPRFSDTLGGDGLFHALAQSRAYYEKIPQDRLFSVGKDQYTAAHMKRSIDFFEEFCRTTPSPDDMTRFIRKYYTVYRSRGRADTGDVLFTGYYELSLKGSLTPDPRRYPVPLYSRPRDLVVVELSRFASRFGKEGKLMARLTPDQRVVPYLTRGEINADDAFHRRAVPVAWVADPVDRFFLEIQGSGRVELDNGDLLRVHYDGKNGHPYRSIGRYLMDRGEIPREKMSMQAIRAWLDAHPERRQEVFEHNPSFVFFRVEKGGPYGSIGVPVTPRRSIATDRRVFPQGALCYVETRMPSRNMPPTDDWDRVSGFVLNQDTGGAVKGPGRVDFFFGHGAWAEFAAGHMNHTGAVYVLVLKN